MGKRYTELIRAKNVEYYLQANRSDGIDLRGPIRYACASWLLLSERETLRDSVDTKYVQHPPSRH